VALVVANSPPVVESEAPKPVEVKELSTREPIREPIAREPVVREARLKVATPAHIEAGMVNAVPAYQR
jgi:hypothetical protein